MSSRLPNANLQNHRPEETQTVGEVDRTDSAVGISIIKALAEFNKNEATTSQKKLVNNHVQNPPAINVPNEQRFLVPNVISRRVEPAAKVNAFYMNAESVTNNFEEIETLLVKPE